MLQGFLTFLFALSCIILIFIVLVQKGKSSLGMGSLGGSNQMLFGGAGGQDIFQKITWVLGIILIFGSLGLAIMKARSHRSIYHEKMAQQNMAQEVAAPVNQETSAPVEESTNTPE